MLHFRVPNRKTGEMEYFTEENMPGNENYDYLKNEIKIGDYYEGDTIRCEITGKLELIEGISTVRGIPLSECKIIK